MIALCKLGPPGQSLNQPKLLGLLAQLKGGRGLCILGSVLPGRVVKDAKTQKVAEKSLRRQRDENKVRGFTQVIMCPDVDAGLTSLIQTAGLGGLAPNTLLLGWSRNWDKDPARAPRMCKLLLEAQAYKMAVVAVKGVEHVPDSAGRMFRPMDLWWVMHDGGLQLLLSTVLRKSRVWQSTALRVFCVVHGDEEDPTALQKKMAEFLYKMRIDAEVKVVVLAEAPTRPASATTSSAAAATAPTGSRRRRAARRRRARTCRRCAAAPPSPRTASTSRATPATRRRWWRGRTPRTAA